MLLNALFTDLSKEHAAMGPFALRQSFGRVSRLQKTEMLGSCVNNRADRRQVNPGLNRFLSEACTRD
jgi:hypothetical protein